MRSTSRSLAASIVIRGGSRRRPYRLSDSGRLRMNDGGVAVVMAVTSWWGFLRRIFCEARGGGAACGVVRGATRG